MARNIQYGIGFSSAIIVGMTLDALNAKTRELQIPIEQALMFHNLNESFPLVEKKDSKKFITENIKDLELNILPKIEELNKMISKINKLITYLDFKHKIPKFKKSEISKIIERRMKTILGNDKTSQKMGNDLFRKMLSEILYKPTKSTKKFLELVKQEEYENSLEKLSSPYQEGIKQALNICSIGYYTTAVFIAGKTIEELINDYYDTLFKAKKIKKIDLKSIKFSDKINKLHSEGFLKEGEYHSLSNIRIDRNEFGHPSSKKLNKEQAHLKIQLIISKIPKIEKKMKRLKTLQG